MKRLKTLLALALVLTFVPLGTGIYAEENSANVTTVMDEATLKQALTDGVEEIALGDNIDVTEKIVVDYPVTIDGKNFALRGNASGTWSGFYVLHVYRTTDVTLKDITLTGGDAGLLVNGSEVTLEGNVNVGGNIHGGIEVSKGEDVTEEPMLYVNGNLVNETEEDGKPTIWLDKITEGVTDGQGLLDKVEETNQVHYYLKEEVKEETTEVATVQDLMDAIAAEAPHITLTVDLEITEKINFLHDVVIDGNGKTISGTDAEGWQGQYALQFYGVKATVKNLNFTKLDAAIIVNGSELTLEGTINLSGNEFGGIELTQGEDVIDAPKLNIENANLINDTEDYGQPTVWTDQTTKAVITGGNLVAKANVKSGQVQYYLVEETPKEIQANNEMIEMFEELKADGFKVNVNKDTNSVQIVKLEGKFDYEEAVDLITQLLLSNDSVRSLRIGDTISSFPSAPSDNPENVRATVDVLLRRNFIVNRSSVAAPEFLDQSIAFELGIEVDGTVVKTNEMSVQFNERGGNGTVDPEVPTDDKEKPKEETKTPNTGIQNTVTMYASLIVMGALVLVALKARKKYN